MERRVDAHGLGGSANRNQVGQPVARAVDDGDEAPVADVEADEPRDEGASCGEVTASAEEHAKPDVAHGDDPLADELEDRAHREAAEHADDGHDRENQASGSSIEAEADGSDHRSEQNGRHGEGDAERQKDAVCEHDRRNLGIGLDAGSCGELGLLFSIGSRLLEHGDDENQRDDADEVNKEAGLPADERQIAAAEFHEDGADVEEREADAQPRCTLLGVLDELEGEGIGERIRPTYGNAEDEPRDEQGRERRTVSQEVREATRNQVAHNRDDDGGAVLHVLAGDSAGQEACGNHAQGNHRNNVADVGTRLGERHGHGVQAGVDAALGSAECKDR